MIVSREAGRIEIHHTEGVIPQLFIFHYSFFILHFSSGFLPAVGDRPSASSGTTGRDMQA